MIQENLYVQFHDGEKRLIRVLLPNDYKNTTEKFPVLYMFDGQNLFNENRQKSPILYRWVMNAFGMRVSLVTRKPI